MPRDSQSSQRPHESAPFVWLRLWHYIPLTQPHCSDFQSARLPLKTDRITSSMEAASISICPHLTSGDRRVTELVPIQALVNISEGYESKKSITCRMPHCHTRLQVHFARNCTGVILDVRKSLGRIDAETDPLSNKFWLAQISPCTDEATTGARDYRNQHSTHTAQGCRNGICTYGVA